MGGCYMQVAVICRWQVHNTHERVDDNCLFFIPLFQGFLHSRKSARAAIFPTVTRTSMRAFLITTTDYCLKIPLCNICLMDCRYCVCL